MIKYINIKNNNPNNKINAIQTTNKFKKNKSKFGKCKE